MKRCFWVDLDSEIYIKYHDEEWGKPTYDDNIFFEFLLLEIFQAGLSWITILKKRENFRLAFDNFDYKKIAKYDDKKINELLLNPGIIRNKLKVNAAINNSLCFIKIQEEFGSFSKYIWGFTNGKIIKNKDNKFRAKTELSDIISKDLKKRGFKFVGSITIYAYLQSIGIVNDHDTDCFRYEA